MRLKRRRLKEGYVILYFGLEQPDPSALAPVIMLRPNISPTSIIEDYLSLQPINTLHEVLLEIKDERGHRLMSDKYKVIK